MSRGLQRERDLVNLLRSEGWWAIRSPASKGCADVIATRRRPWKLWDGTPVAEVRLIECKSTVSPYAHFGPTDREDLLAEAQKAGATAELAWWPKNGKLVFLSSDEWPKPK